MNQSDVEFSNGFSQVDPPRSARSPGAAATTIWLDALVRGLDLPAPERQHVRMELHSHIEDRVRDLMVEGVEEGEATRRALGECGEASSLAGGFREVKKALRRRTLMNIGVVGAACGAVALGFGSFRNKAAICPPEQSAVVRQGVPLQVVEGSEVREVAGYNLAVAAGEARSPQDADAGSRLAEVRNTGLEDVLTFVGRQSGHPFAVNWASLATMGIERTTVVDATIPTGDPHEMIAVLNDVLGGDPDAGPGPLAIRERGEMMEIASAVWVDKHDMQLETYDISFAMESGVSPDDLHAAIVQFIEPSNWKDNGGERADMSVLGARFVVKAPGRMHEKVKWMLEQFSENADGLTRVALPEPGAGEPGQPSAMSEPGAGEPESRAVRSVVMRHADARLVGQLVASMARRSPQPLNVKVRASSGRNSILLQGTPADVVRCQQFAAIVDGAMSGNTRIVRQGVPLLHEIPLVNKFYSDTAEIQLPSSLETVDSASAK